jgi:mycothione reductase
MDTWRLAIVEPDAFGGTCLNRGCIPSKMLIYAAEVIETARHGSQMGIYHRLERVDWQRVVGRVWEKIDPIATAGATYRASQDNITLFNAPARFVDQRILETGGQYITAERIVLAAGSRPLLPDLPGLADVPHHTSDTIMRLPTQPASMLIIGGGYIGAEMAHFFGALGTQVTIVDHGDAHNVSVRRSMGSPYISMLPARHTRSRQKCSCLPPDADPTRTTSMLPPPVLRSTAAATC